MKTNRRLLLLFSAFLMISMLLPIQASAYGMGGLDDRLDGPAAPSGLTPTAPTFKGGDDGTIGGVTIDMEYSIDDGENWIPVNAAPITGLAPGKVLVRYAGTDTVKPGDSAEVTVPDYFEVEDSNSTIEPNSAQILSTPTPDADPKSDNADKGVKTGDSNNLLFYGFSTLLALLGAGFIYGLRRKGKR